MKIFETKIRSERHLKECTAIWKQSQKELSKTNTDVVFKISWDDTDTAQIIFKNDSGASWFALMHGDKFELVNS
jgi:predicted Ser/Thr protein kinase